jgi:hypothetical protein
LISALTARVASGAVILSGVADVVMVAGAIVSGQQGDGTADTVLDSVLEVAATTGGFSDSALLVFSTAEVAVAHSGDASYLTADPAKLTASRVVNDVAISGNRVRFNIAMTDTQGAAAEPLTVMLYLCFGPHSPVRFPVDLPLDEKLLQFDRMNRLPVFRDGIGLYHSEFIVPNSSGRWYVVWDVVGRVGRLQLADVLDVSPLLV